jgi:hypothetical protein
VKEQEIARRALDGAESPEEREQRSSWTMMLLVMQQGAALHFLRFFLRNGADATGCIGVAAHLRKQQGNEREPWFTRVRSGGGLQ